MRSAPPGSQGEGGRGGEGGRAGIEKGGEEEGEGEGDDSDLGELVTDDLLQLGTPVRHHLSLLRIHAYTCESKNIY